jgi:hypothetical protein
LDRRTSLIQRKDASVNAGYIQADARSSLMLGPRSECGPSWSWSRGSGEALGAMGLTDDGLLRCLPGVDLLEGATMLYARPVHHQQLPTMEFVWLSHRYGVHHLRGRARRSWFARVAGQPRAVAKQHAARLIPSRPARPRPVRVYVAAHTTPWSKERLRLWMALARVFSTAAAFRHPDRQGSPPEDDRR